MRVLHGAADLDEEMEPLLGVEVFLVAEGGDRGAAHQFNHEVEPPLLGLAAVEDAGDVRVVHHGERLALGLEAGDDLARVHACLEDFDRDAAADRFGLIGHVDGAEATLADFLKDLVAVAGAEPGASLKVRGADVGRWWLQGFVGQGVHRGEGIGHEACGTDVADSGGREGLVADLAAGWGIGGGCGHGGSAVTGHFR